MVFRDPRPRPRPPFDGWRMVAAAFTLAAFGWGVGFYGPPVYLEAVREARGWSVALVSGAVTLHFLAGVLVVANLPRLHRRFGIPTVTVAGAAALAAGVLGWASAREPWQLYAATLASGMGWVTLGAAALNAIVSPWFSRGRPAALSMAYNGASVGGIVFSPLWAALIGRMGFPLAAILVGTVMLAVVTALSATLLGRTPEGLGQHPDGGPAPAANVLAHPPTAPEAARVVDLRRDPAFLTLAAGMALALVAQIGLLAHLVSLLTPGMGREGAGLAAGLATAAALAGRLAAGGLMPERLDRRLAAIASLGVQAAGCAVLALGSGRPAATLAGVALFGLGIGNATSLPPLVAQREFAREDAARAVALAVASAQAAYALAPALFGWLREAAGGNAVFVAAALVQAAAVGAYAAGRERYRGR